MTLTHPFAARATVLLAFPLLALVTDHAVRQRRLRVAGQRISLMSDPVLELRNVTKRDLAMSSQSRCGVAYAQPWRVPDFSPASSSDKTTTLIMVVGLQSSSGGETLIAASHRCRSLDIGATSAWSSSIMRCLRTSPLPPILPFRWKCVACQR